MPFKKITRSALDQLNFAPVWQENNAFCKPQLLAGMFRKTLQLAKKQALLRLENQIIR
jgi:hypothetical protein